MKEILTAIRSLEDQKAMKLFEQFQFLNQQEFLLKKIFLKFYELNWEAELNLTARQVEKRIFDHDRLVLKLLR